MDLTGFLKKACFFLEFPGFFKGPISGAYRVYAKGPGILWILVTTKDHKYSKVHLDA